MKTKSQFKKQLKTNPGFKGRTDGWVSVSFSILLILILSLLIYFYFFQLQLNREMALDKTCRTEQQKIMNHVRNNLNFIFSLNHLSRQLVNTQKVLRPFIWKPEIARVYQKIQSYREQMDTLQRNTINSMNSWLSIQKWNLYIKLDKKLY
ncbi:MAG: hypothetical protein KDD45_17935, partial [Bdellovibrionales bacterium]|nr:hypothetical protein [Bdellovibrionales bacterium]